MANDFEDLLEDLLRRIEERPAWESWYYKIRRGVIKLRPRRIKDKLEHYWQRLRRGWSYQDAWSADWYWHRLHIEMLRHLADIAHGWPGDEYITFKEYVAMMREIADAFELEMKAQEGWRDLTEFEAKRVDRAWENFRKYYWSFWN